jgi:hypothetical protein
VLINPLSASALTLTSKIVWHQTEQNNKVWCIRAQGKLTFKIDLQYREPYNTVVHCRTGNIITNNRIEFID